MSELRTDFKDEILQEGEEHRVYNIKRKNTDKVVESDIYLEKAYTPSQEGDEFGAKEVNEINGRLNGLAPQNLLINGDFKINQRGQTEYTSTDWQSSRAIDCWRIGGRAILHVDTDRITLEATGSSKAYLVAHIDKDLTGKKLSVAVKVQDDKVYTGTVTVSTNETVFINDGQYMTVSAKYDSNRKGTQLYINIKGGHSYPFEYVDAFEGEIVYPHVEEDYATALMRCQQYLRAEYYMAHCIFSYGDGRRLLRFAFERMNDIPSIKLTIDYLDSQGMNHNTTNYSVQSTLNGVVTFLLNDTTTNAVNNGAVRVYAEITCEPL